MKNLILSALLTVAIATRSFATGETSVNYFVLNNFNRDFKGVTNVNWITKTDYSKATFMQDNRKMEVFYTLAGSLLAVSKTIQLDELPVSAKRTFAKKYEGYTVKEAIQYDGTDEESYYISAENEKESVIIKVDQDEHLSLFKKSKK